MCIIVVRAYGALADRDGTAANASVFRLMVTVSPSSPQKTTATERALGNVLAKVEFTRRVATTMAMKLKPIVRANGWDAARKCFHTLMITATDAVRKSTPPTTPSS